MNIEDLYLEVTRFCTLKCEHCLRGDSEKKNMSIETLENILKDVHRIDTLLLSGGEPFINIKVLEELPRLIEKYQIEINRIGIITNGTIYTERHKRALERLMKSCKSLECYISSDLFHRLEWKRLGIEEQINNNYEAYKQSIPIEKHLEHDCFHNVSLNAKGRAKGLTEERLKELQRKYYINYRLEERKEEGLSIEEDMVHGKVCIDIHGFLVGFNKSFQEEDEEACISYNVNCKPLPEIIPNYIATKQAPINKCYSN